jgi:hypothetical protein
VDLGGVALNVPEGREVVYRNASVWRLFGSIATGNEAVPEPPPTSVRYEAGVLTVHSPSAERVNVYSPTGAHLFGAAKPSGPASFALPQLRGVGIVIATGSSGWTKKIYINAY